MKLSEQKNRPGWKKIHKAQFLQQEERKPGTHLVTGSTRSQEEGI